MMDNTARPQDEPGADEQGANAALQALERLTLQSGQAEHDASTQDSSSRTNGTLPIPLNRQGSGSTTASQPGRTSSRTPTLSTSPEALRRVPSNNSTKGGISSPRFSRPSSGAFHRTPSQASTHSAVVEPAPLTAASVGAEFFAKELASHRDADTETLVIIHEACYGHRFSRPRTSKAALSTIVERPERMTAVILGLATAYVRLGSRHAGGLAAPKPGAQGGKPPFAIRRSSRFVGLTSPAVVAVHGLDWMNELQSMCLAAGARLAMDGRELLRPARVDALGRPVEQAQLHEGDLYLCAESLDALQGAIGGVCDAVDAVFSETLTKRAFVAVRPPGHHCSADYPSGFCWLNNVHVAIQHAAQTYGLTHAVILDFDLHHGDGSQDVAWTINERNQAMGKNTAHSKKAAIGYYSLHDINSYPCEMGDRDKVLNASMCIDNAHGQSIWNVHLEPWSDEAEFARLYETRYSVIFDKARKFLQKHTEKIKAAPKGGAPRAAIFLSAGFDASQWEGAGMQRHAVNVPTSFYERFTKDAVQLAQDASTGVEGRVISVLEGGYSDRALTSGAMAHVSGLCQPVAASGLNEDLERMQLDASTKNHMQPVDHRWWNLDALHALESYAAVDPPKKPRNSGFAATFASPTESFSHKVIDHEKFQRSMSGTWRPIPEVVDTSVPEVDWIAASHALCKAIVPSTRCTTSCRPDELSAAKMKKQRQSDGPIITPADPNTAGRQLRERKSKTNLADDETPKAKGGRRKTLDPPLTPATPGATPSQGRRTSRRSSAVKSELVGPQHAVPAVPSIPAAYQSVPSTPLAPLKTAAAAAHKRRSPAKPGSRIPTQTPLKSESSVSSAGSRIPSLKTESTGGSYATAPSTPDVDSLVGAVRRITLKLGSREEHERRARSPGKSPVKGRSEESVTPGLPAPIAQAVAGQVAGRGEVKTEQRVPSWSATGHIPFASG